VAYASSSDATTVLDMVFEVETGRERYRCRKPFVSSLALAIIVRRLMIVCSAAAGSIRAAAGVGTGAACVGASCGLCQGKRSESSVSGMQGFVAECRRLERVVRGARGSGYGRLRPRRLRLALFA